ncbi:MAG: DinB family protein [Candidatus Limnocylindrales bacterium]
MTADWVAALEPGAPDVVAAWRGIDEGQLISVRREVRRRAGTGTAQTLAEQLAVLAEALAAVVGDLSDDDLRRDGGEGGWNVAQAVGHAAESRSGLCLAAAKAAAGQWPADAPAVVQGIAGVADADQPTLIRKIAQSQRIVERCARTVAGHELEPCPLDHPQVGRLRCGEWLLFAGVHDVMHLDQLHGLVARKETRP